MGVTSFARSHSAMSIEKVPDLGTMPAAKSTTSLHPEACEPHSEVASAENQWCRSSRR